MYPEKEEIDHRVLCSKLVVEYDGFALSCHTPSLGYLLKLLPTETRVLAWVKPFAAYRKNIRPQFAWEPVLLYGSRSLPSGSFQTHRDWFYGMPPIFNGHRADVTNIKGTKSEDFCIWILNCLGFSPSEDTMDDLYPGSGVMGRVATGFVGDDGANAQSLRLVPKEESRRIRSKRKMSTDEADEILMAKL